MILGLLLLEDVASIWHGVTGVLYLLRYALCAVVYIHMFFCSFAFIGTLLLFPSFWFMLLTWPTHYQNSLFLNHWFCWVNSLQRGSLLRTIYDLWGYKSFTTYIKEIYGLLELGITRFLFKSLNKAGWLLKMISFLSFSGSVQLRLGIK